MGARTARARHRKDLARRRKLAEKAGYQARRAYYREYPDVDFRPGDAPDGFVRLMREGVAAVRLDDRGRFTREESREFAILKRDGFPVWPATLIKYGEQVFSSVAEDRLLRPGHALQSQGGFGKTGEGHHPGSSSQVQGRTRHVAFRTIPSKAPGNPRAGGPVGENRRSPCLRGVGPRSRH